MPVNESSKALPLFFCFFLVVLMGADIFVIFGGYVECQSGILQIFLILVDEKLFGLQVSNSPF